MATSAAQSPRIPTPPPAGDGSDAENLGFIHQQLRRTALHVKLVDLLASLVLLTIGVLGYLLAVAVVDGWILELGYWGRLLALLVMLGGVGWFLTVRVGPLIFRRINPIYAAQTIEHSEPTLKNSLINFLMLRRNRSSVHHAVYSAVEQRAAKDLHHVPVDASVDHSILIRLGYVLVGVAAICALYKIFSPKDPFQTWGRVAAPFANLSRPARVEIDEVLPGNKQVYMGEQVAVTATVKGLRQDEKVELLYGKPDAKSSRLHTLMTRQGDGQQYTALLPPGEEGLQHDLVYAIEAGDARSSDYKLIVVPAPTIAIEQLQYDYPRYTKLPPRTVQKHGDIRALEGTQVTIRAQANQPIKHAYIELDPAGDTSQRGIKRDMQFEGNRAWYTLTLQLKSDRKTPRYSSYRVMFSNRDSAVNREAVSYKIAVTRDLPPEVEILTPKDDLVEVPENGQQKIEVRSIDPDFALSKIVLRGIERDKDITLLSAPPEHQGQAVVDYDFRPSELGFKAGDVVSFRALAIDNRTLRGTKVKPNEATTREYRLKIVPPKESPADDETPKDKTRDPGDGKKPDDPKTEPMKKSDGGSKDENKSSGDKSDSPQDGKNGQDKKDGSDGGGESGEKKDGENKDQDGEKGDSDGKGGSENGGGSSDKKEGGQDSSKQGGSSGNQSGDQGDQQNGGEGSQKGQPSGGEKGQPGKGDQGQQQGEGGSKSGSQQGGKQEKLHDGEVIEKALEHRRQQQNADGKGAGGKQNSQQKNPDGGKSGDGKQGGSSQSGDDKKQPGQKQDSGAGSQDQGDQKNAAGDKQGDMQGADGGQKDKNQGAGQEKKGASGGDKQGGEQNGGDKTKPDGGSESKQGQKKEGGQGNNGQSGAGKKSQDKKGAGGQQGENQDRKKNMKDGGGNDKQGSDGKSPSKEKRQSDSKGGDSGDKKGGGKQGSGQGAKQQGNDSAGGSSPADQGAGKADQRGMGETGEKSGDGQKAEGKTGSTDKQPGTNGEKRDGETGTSKDGGKPKAGSGRKSSSKGKQSKSNSAGDSPTNKGGRPDGERGVPSQSTGPRSPQSVDEEDLPLDDPADLEHARKATDLALDYLKDQQDNRELLDKLNMSKKELQQFMDRWEKMKRSAQRPGKSGSDAGRDLDDTLRSLGLRPEGSKRRSSGTRDDKFRNLRGDGDRSQPPAEYLERFRQFKKSAARSKQD